MFISNFLCVPLLQIPISTKLVIFANIMVHIKLIDKIACVTFACIVSNTLEKDF